MFSVSCILFSLSGFNFEERGLGMNPGCFYQVHLFMYGL